MGPLAYGGTRGAEQDGGYLDGGHVAIPRRVGASAPGQRGSWPHVWEHWPGEPLAAAVARRLAAAARWLTARPPPALAAVGPCAVESGGVRHQTSGRDATWRVELALALGVHVAQVRGGADVCRKGSAHGGRVDGSGGNGCWVWLRVCAATVWVREDGDAKNLRGCAVGGSTR